MSAPHDNADKRVLPSRRAFLPLLAGAGSLALGACAATRSTSVAARDTARAPRQSDRLPSVPVVDQHGKRHRFYDDLVADRAVLIAFFYTQCNGSCPATIGALQRLRRDLAAIRSERVSLLTLTLDAANDDVAALRDYADAAGIVDDPALPPWKLLTGTPDDLEAVRLAVGYRDPDPAVDAVRSNHAALITAGNDRLDRWCTLPAGLRHGQLLRGVVRALTPGTPLPS